MRREAAILQTLRHPNIVRLYEVMETENNFYMVLELCTGGPLLDKICSEGKLSEVTTKRFVRQMLSAVDHIHQAGVLHRYFESYSNSFQPKSIDLAQNGWVYIISAKSNKMNNSGILYASFIFRVRVRLWLGLGY